MPNIVRNCDGDWIEIDPKENIMSYIYIVDHAYRMIKPNPSRQAILEANKHLIKKNKELKERLEKAEKSLGEFWLYDY